MFSFVKVISFRSKRIGLSTGSNIALRKIKSEKIVTMLFILLRDYKILFGVPQNFFIA